MSWRCCFATTYSQILLLDEIQAHKSIENKMTTNITYERDASMQFKAIQGQPCRVCGSSRRPLRPVQDPTWAFCEQHNPLPEKLQSSQDDWEAALGGFLVWLTDRFIRDWIGYPEPTAEGSSFWADLSQICDQQCEHSLVWMSGCLEALVDFDRRTAGRIREILELKFWTGPYYKFRHCAFIIMTDDEHHLVFDPTGIQFGLDWPLLSPLSEPKGLVPHGVYGLKRVRHLDQVTLEATKQTPYALWIVLLNHGHISITAPHKRIREAFGFDVQNSTEAGSDDASDWWAPHSLQHKPERQRHTNSSQRHEKTTALTLITVNILNKRDTLGQNVSKKHLADSKSYLCAITGPHVITTD
ncbi:hypothetical protein IAQ61_010683, partial [Plenodomus lingam]|uniref:Predicted protein n=1 Tax=Leptosphaeria maculans (strain JN3 / isolate v23.1.3 / race Av1-4-5-6-7-8) TaxID=985895 RepID=E4ZJN5_LEPMJ